MIVTPTAEEMRQLGYLGQYNQLLKFLERTEEELVTYLRYSDENKDIYRAQGAFNSINSLKQLILEASRR